MTKPSQSELSLYRLLIGLAGAFYATWWGLVELLIPGSFNPLPGRLVAVAFCFVVLAVSFFSDAVAERIDLSFAVATSAVSLHYFYLVHRNHGAPDWIVGGFILVVAVSACLSTRALLVGYAAFVWAMAIALMILNPSMRRSIFLPGLVTVLLFAYIALRARTKLLEEATESNARFESLFHATFEGIVVIDDGRIVDANEALAELLGFSRREIIGRSVIDLIAPGSREQTRAIVASDAPGPHAADGLHKDGSLIALEIIVKSHVYGGRPVRLAAVRDVRERRRAEEEHVQRIEAQAERDQAKRANETKSRFLGLVSHELITPLQSMLLGVGGMQRHKENLTPAQNERIEAIARSCHRLISLIQSVLEYTRLERGQLEAPFEPVDLAAMASDVVDELRGLATQKEAQNERVVVRLVPHDPMPMTDSNPRLLRILMVNLLTNAIRFTKRGSIDVAVEHGPEGHRLSIKDTGCGISEMDIARIFEPFTQLEAVEHKHVPGVGLGLAIVGEIATALGARVEVASTVGVGSTFTVILPPR